MTDKTPLDDSKIAEIRKEFDFFDHDKNGQIDLPEFIELLTILSPKTKASHVQEGFSLIDENNDGFIDFEEFLDWWQEAWWEY
ncbi:MULTISPECIES: EF-hand domain-containing protein [Alteromonadaceae]|uniref:EF-hand domain-containing protein n=1 Tax=Alteromonadaceae TaxID=72275 RepID=UPI001C09DC48|nr:MULTISPECIES: EF-hand domain-containing protein [Aliiglaciecola]MBU2876100.1 EF-hand domain-containing protein [Aliiglaciecola lipolytica]MDO6712170.1 EF-hand domain-containing protein [Aliiglaciecola sp. 2_MG-2023]MDO6754564.1 EF-hand domain-containing protein [Aliiglaciecola sp. 1_MG-2023]